MRVIGIDPGYAIVGFGILDYIKGGFAVIDYGAITTASDLPIEKRLDVIFSDLSALLAEYKPDLAGVERLFFTANHKTAMDVAHARGVILLALSQAGVALKEYTPLQVKMSVTGYGKAVKKQVQEMTRNILRLREVPKPDDTADALAVAVCTAHSSLSAAGTANPLRALPPHSRNER